MIDGGEIAEPFGQVLGLDDGFGRHGESISFGHIGKGDIGGHAGAQLARLIVQAHLDAKDLLDAFADGLYIARRELGSAGDLLDQVLVGDPMTTNVCWGGADMRTAYVTCSGTGRLISVPWPRPGLKLNFA